MASRSVDGPMAWLREKPPHPLVGKLVLPVLWVALGVYLIVVGVTTDPIGSDDVFGPGGFPMLVGAVLVLLGLWLGVGEVRAEGRNGAGSDREAPTGAVDRLATSPATADPDPAEGDAPASVWRPFAVIVITAGYLLVLPVVGFVIATAVTVAVIATLTARRWSWGLAVAYPIAVTAVLYGVFAILLNIRLP